MRKIILLIFFLCTFAVSSKAQVAPVTSCTAAASTSCTLSATPAFGDLMISMAYRSGSATAPTTATGWTVIKSTTGSTNSLKTAWKFSTGTETTCGSWSNATQTFCEVYSGWDVRSSGPVGSTTSGTTGSSTTMSFPTMTLNDTGGTGWVACAGGGASATNVDASSLSGTQSTTLRSGTAEDNIGFWDTAGGVTAWAAHTLSVSPTGNWATACFEIFAAPGSSGISNYLVDQVYTGQAAEDCSGACDFTIPIPLSGGSLSNNFLNVALSWGYSSSAPTISSVYCNSDTGHATWTWTEFGQKLTDSNSDTVWDDYYIDGATAGCTSVTFVFGSAWTSVVAHYTEWRQIETSSAVDTAASENNTGFIAFNTAGSITTANNGEIIYEFCGVGSYPISGLANNPVYGPAGATLLGPDNSWTIGAQAFVQTTKATSFSTYMDLTGLANYGDCLTLALIPSSGAGTSPTGAQVISQTQVTVASAATMVVQGTVLNSGDTILVAGNAGSIGQTGNQCTGITDSVGNTWTIKQNSSGNAVPLFAFDSNSTSGNDQFTLTGCETNGEGTWSVIEMSGLKNSSHTASYDSTMGLCSATGNTGTGSGPYTYPSAPGSCSPSTSNGIVIAQIALGTGPTNGISSPSGATFNYPTFTGMTDTDLMTLGGGLSYLYNSGTSSVSWTWTGDASSAAWVSSALAFEKAVSSSTPSMPPVIF